MNIQRWVARREKSWKRLDALLRQLEKRGIRSLTAPEIRQLASLYRSTSADLARAQTQKSGNLILQNLQTLVSRSYAQIYQGSRRQEWQAVWQFYRWGFPAAVQRSAGYIALATALLIGSGLICWWFSWQDPTFMTLEIIPGQPLVPPNIVTQVRDRHELWMGSIVGVEPLASSQIMINNIKVSFAAFAGGISAGAITTYILLMNGASLGAISALVAQNNLSYPFWAFVFPHGALELPAIFLAAGAGLLLARAILFPGQYRRIDALKQYGQQAIELIYGVVPMLVVAGTIEGFFSPSPIVPSPLKYLVGIGLFVALVRYLQSRKVQENNP